MPGQPSKKLPHKQKTSNPAITLESFPSFPEESTASRPKVDEVPKMPSHTSPASPVEKAVEGAAREAEAPPEKAVEGKFLNPNAPLKPLSRNSEHLSSDKTSRDTDLGIFYGGVKPTVTEKELEVGARIAGAAAKLAEWEEQGKPSRFGAGGSSDRNSADRSR